MKIISKFKDYYDSAVGYGIDPNLTYRRTKHDFFDDSLFDVFGVEDVNDVRQTVIGSLKSAPDSNFNYEFYVDGIREVEGYRTGSAFVGFCGVVYPAIHIYKRKPTVRVPPRNKVTLDDVSGSKIVFNIDELIKFGEEMRLPDLLANFGFVKSKPLARDIKHYESTKRELTEFFASRPKCMDEIFFKTKTPIFVLKCNNMWGDWCPVSLVVNDELNQYRFDRFFDPYTAFQEISMFIGGVLGTEGNPMVEVSDEVRIHKAGMDKTSFRNMSPIKKPPRKVKS